jgi:hypothetical protein
MAPIPFEARNCVNSHGSTEGEHLEDLVGAVLEGEVIALAGLLCRFQRSLEAA